MAGPETPSPAPATAPTDFNARIQEILGPGDVPVARLRELRAMLPDPRKLQEREALLQRLKGRIHTLQQPIGTGAKTPEQAELEAELQALRSQLDVREAGLREQGRALTKRVGEKGKEVLGETIAGAPSVFTNYLEGGAEAWKRNKFEGAMSFAVPVLCALGAGLLAKKALKKPKGMLAKVLVGILGLGGVIALANYAGRKAQAEQIERQARRPVEGRVKELIDAIKGGAKVDINDPRLIDVDFLQLRSAPIIIDGHRVSLERTTEGIRPVLYVTVDGNTFDLGIVAATAIQSVIRRRGMADVASLLCVPTGHAYVTDAEFKRIVSLLAQAKANTPVEVEFVSDSSKPDVKKRQKIDFTYVPPAKTPASGSSRTSAPTAASN